jgi:hypothetical protein
MSTKDQELADKIADAVYGKVAGTFTDFMSNMEEGQKGFHEDIKGQMARIDKKIVGWKWFIIILIAWSVFMFSVFVYYHNNYITTGRKVYLFNRETKIWGDELKQSQLNGVSPITRSLSVNISQYSEEQKDSIRKENVRQMEISAEKDWKEYKDKYGKK